MDSSKGTNRKPSTNNVLNTQQFTCYTFPDWLVIEIAATSSRMDNPDRVLRVNRSTGEFNEVSRSDVRFDEKNYVFRSFSAFLGIVVLEGLRFLMFCDECREASHSAFLPAYEIHSIFMVSLLNDHDLILSGRKRSILKKITDLNDLLSRGFYYSLEYNMTRTRQHQDMLYRQEFTWNKSYILELSKAKNIKPEWIVPVMQGFVASFNCYFEGNQLDYFLVSRRSWHKGGPRYFDRGVNEEGWVANFVETEQLLVLGSYVVSDVQIRGSVPIYFEQRGLTTKVQITRSNELARQSYHRHFEYCRRLYDRTFCVNLLALGKDGQRTIIEQYQRHIREENDEEVNYVYFDFHKRCGSDFSRVNEVVEKVAEQKRNLCYFLQDISNGNVLNRQMGVFRTNCLDCLDRTNFFQAKLALLSVQQILQFFGLDLRKMFLRTALEEMDAKENLHSFMRSFKTIWADNGDMISYHYTGTGSTHTDITRDGTRGFTGTFKHKLKTITRFYNQHFWDFDRVRMINLLLQNNQSEVEACTIPAKLKEREKEYSSFSDVRIHVLSWKVSNLAVPADLIPIKSCDVLVVGLQELESSSMFGFKSINEEKVQKWETYFLKCLDQANKIRSSNSSHDADKFIPVRRLGSSNNLIMVLAKEDLKDRLSDIETSAVPFGNYLSSKCAVLIRMEIDDTPIVFIGCQLDYGRQYSKNRIDNIRTTYRKAFQEEEVGRKKSEPIRDTPVKILFGNLNTNLNIDEPYVRQRLKEINSDYNECRGLLKSSEMYQTKSKQLRQSIQALMKNDEIAMLKESEECLREYEEGPVDFIPPYKYQKGKTKLDESKCGGWVDRILYDSQEPIKCLEYGVHELFLTDHLPIYTVLSLRVCKEDPARKKAVYEQILKDLRLSEPEEEPQEEL